MLDVKAVLKEKGISVTELAERLGITQITLSRNINGNPTLETLQKIADEIGVDIRELFTNESVETPIYIKDKSGNEKVIGYVNMDKIGFIFK